MFFFEDSLKLFFSLATSLLALILNKLQKIWVLNYVINESNVLKIPDFFKSNIIVYHKLRF